MWVGLYKKGTGRPSITWPEAVDEALCFGWIDSVRISLDDESYTNRFTPRKASSTWSDVNVARAQQLLGEGRMRPAGSRAFAERREARTAVYAYEQRDNPQFDAAQDGLFRADAAAWAWFQQQAPSYRKAATWWVISAKQDATRHNRLARLIADSGEGRRVPPLRRPQRRQ